MLVIIRIILLAFAMICAGGFSHGQEGGFLIFGGPGITNQPGDAGKSLHLGAGFSFMDPVALGSKYRFNNIPLGLILELNYAGPLKDLRSGSAVVSTNYAVGFLTETPFVPFFTVGYSRIFGTGNALNFGGGIDYAFKDSAHVFRFEVRDYKRFSGARENDVAFRVGYYISFGGD
jgi:hypothetical protein